MALPVGFLVKRVQGAFRGHMDRALAAQGLTAATYAALFHLRGAEPASGADLARAAWVTPQTMHRITTDLEAKGYVRRSHTAGRAVLFVLTDAGRRVLADADAAVMAVEERMCAGLDAGERRQLAGLLERCAAALEG